VTGLLTVEVLGLRVRIELPGGFEPERFGELAAAWSGAAVLDDAPPVDLTVPFAVGDDFHRAMERLTVDVTLAALDALRGKALLFHAGGVADEQGRVVAFVGPSGRGKTTLSRALGEHYGYVSDETIAVDADLRVHPYRKPLSVVRHGAPKKQVSTAEAGLRDLPDAPLRLTALVLMDRDGDVAAPELVPVGLAEALPELVEQMSYLRDHPRPVSAIAALHDAVGGLRRLRYADASTVAPMVERMLAHPASPSEWAPITTASDTGPFDTAHVDDAITTEGFVVVMVDAVLHVLDGIAPVIWQAAAQGSDTDAIVDAVVAEFGAPPHGDARALVEAALDELIRAGVLRRR